jgi:flagellar biogenesis protein FliO
MSLTAALVAISGTTAAPDVSITHLLLQMVVAMVLVVGGIWGFGKLMGRSRAAGRNAGRAAGGFFRSRATNRAHEDGLTVLSRQPVGKGKYLAVVQVGAQQFLVGIADSGLTPLGELRAGDPEPAPDEDPLPIAARQSAPTASVEFGPTEFGATEFGATEFGPTELGAMDLSALGVAPMDLGSPLVRVGGNRPASAARSPMPSAPARPTASRPSGPPRTPGPAPIRPPARRQAPPTARAVASAAQQPPRSVRSLVESLREATVRR